MSSLNDLTERSNGFKSGDSASHSTNRYEEQGYSEEVPPLVKMLIHFHCSDHYVQECLSMRDRQCLVIIASIFVL